MKSKLRLIALVSALSCGDEIHNHHYGKNDNNDVPTNEYVNNDCPLFEGKHILAVGGCGYGTLTPVRDCYVEMEDPEDFGSSYEPKLVLSGYARGNKLFLESTFAEGIDSDIDGNLTFTFTRDINKSQLTNDSAVLNDVFMCYLEQDNVHYAVWNSGKNGRIGTLGDLFKITNEPFHGSSICGSETSASNWYNVCWEPHRDE